MLRRRDLIAGAVGAALIRCPAQARSWDIIISKTGRAGSVNSLEAALRIVRNRPGGARIRLERGLYREKPRIDVPDIYIEGEGPESILTFGAAAGLPDPNGKKWGTGGSATLTVTSPGVTLARMTIRNDFDYVADRISGASSGAQAVALSLARGHDRSIVRDCVIEGYQDTLYVQEGGRAWFRDCLVSGNVDFIFGGAVALFERCEVRSRYVPGMETQGFVAAPSTPYNQPIGLVFDRCRLTRERGLPRHSVYLGRPWRAGGNMNLIGAAMFLNCWLDDHIKPEGWAPMGYTDPRGVRTQLTPQEARLFEIGSRGPGAAAAQATRRQLTKRDAVQFDRSRMFLDWRAPR